MSNRLRSRAPELAGARECHAASPAEVRVWMGINLINACPVVSLEAPIAG
jgi:hypothetical protein